MISREEIEQKLRWGYTFFKGDGRLDEDDSLCIIAEATWMYLLGKDHKKIKTESYEGSIKQIRKLSFLGSFCGPQYEATLETNFGKCNLIFLVSEQTIDRCRNN